jgi:glutamyl-tRNA reductase
MRAGQESAEQIRRREVSRALRKVDLSPEVEEVIERMSRSLVGRLLHGPISRVMAHAEVKISSVGRRGAETLCRLEGHGDEPPRSETDRVSGSTSRPVG